jgi:murein L,D-transpeptidase YcbB/YkuD
MVKSVRFERLLASTAFGLILALSSHAGLAQQTGPQVEASISVPDTSAAVSSDAANDAAAPASQDTAKPESDSPSTDTKAESKADGAAESKPDAASKDTTAEPPAASKDAGKDAAQTEPKTGSETEPKQDAAAPADKDTAKSDTAKGATDSKSDTATESNKEPKQDAAAPAAEPAKAADAPEATPKPVTIDTQVADQLRDLITGKRFDRFITRKDDRAGVEQFYSARDYKPLWTSDGAADARAKAAIAYLGQVDTVALDPRDYPTPHFGASATPEQLAQDELRLTNSVLNYAREAQIGRIHFSRVGPDISFKLVAPEPAAVLAKLADSDDTAAALDSYNPPQADFKALKKKLAELRTNGGQINKPKDKPEVVRVPGGKILRPGMKDARVVALRKRLDIAGDKDNPLYDDEVVDAVKAFQTRADIGVDGMLGPNTVAALNGEHAVHAAPADPIDTVVVNMERWRWLPRKLGNDDDDYVVENTPDFTLSLFHHDKLYWKTKIVVGKPGKATPMTSAEMKYITVNPTWNVPPSIIENEYLPALAEDPTVLDRYGLKIYQDPDGTVHIYQPPGAGNALGRIRFNFPNKFLVYQHDTPDKYLFKRAKRAYSHGCMRVENPLVYGEKLLSIELPKEHYTPAKLESMFGSNEININFPKPIPVHLTYQTAFVDQDGKLQFREDVYGRDARMIQILKGNERKVADIPIERPRDASVQPVRMPVGTYGSFGNEPGYAYSSGPNFFDFLFGGGGPRYQPRNRAPRPRGYIGGPHADSNGHYYSRR